MSIYLFKWTQNIYLLTQKYTMAGATHHRVKVSTYGFCIIFLFIKKKEIEVNNAKNKEEIGRKNNVKFEINAFGNLKILLHKTFPHFINSASLGSHSYYYWLLIVTLYACTSRSKKSLQKYFGKLVECRIKHWKMHPISVRRNPYPFKIIIFQFLNLKTLFVNGDEFSWPDCPDFRLTKRLNRIECHFTVDDVDNMIETQMLWFLQNRSFTAFCRRRFQ